MASPIWRSSESKLDLDVTNSVGTTEEIDFRQFSSAWIYCPASASSTTITIHGSASAGGTYDSDLVNNAGNNVNNVTVAAGKWHQLPDSIFAFPFIKIVSGADDSGLTWQMVLKG